VRLVDNKGRRHNFELTVGKRFFSNKGHLEHDDMIGREEGFTLTSSAGGQYLVFRPLLSEFVVSMPRGAAVVYPKDSAQIIAMADIFPGAKVIEAGVGSGALTCSLLRAVGPWGHVVSYERRSEFADVARRNVSQFFNAPDGRSHPAWDLRLGDLVEGLRESGERADRVILDMLAPWECIDAVAEALVPGGIVCAYVATTTQLSRVVETLRAHGGFTEPQPWESLVRDWHGTCGAAGTQDDRAHRLPGDRTADGPRRAAPGQEASPGARSVRGRLLRTPPRRPSAAGTGGEIRRLTLRGRQPSVTARQHVADLPCALGRHE
jgi:tRNA (adenine57-N1/adenine58-N1)-methyltransferase